MAGLFFPGFFGRFLALKIKEVFEMVTIMKFTVCVGIWLSGFFLGMFVRGTFF